MEKNLMVAKIDTLLNLDKLISGNLFFCLSPEKKDEKTSLKGNLDDVFFLGGFYEYYN